MNDDLISRQALIVELPCKIGDTMWGIRDWRGKPCIRQGTVSEMFFNNDMQIIIVLYGICRGLLGKKIFCTFEEAERALKMKGETE